MYQDSVQHKLVEVPDGYSKICLCGKRHGPPKTGPRTLEVETCGCKAGKNKNGLTHVAKRKMTISPRNY